MNLLTISSSILISVFDSLGYIDTKDPYLNLEEFTSNVELKHRYERFVLQPNDFVLAQTIEKVQIPSNIVGIVEGRSSFGRLGLLVHATAGYIDPGFEGNITLVKDINSSGKTIFIKYAFVPASQVKHLDVQEDTSEDNISSVSNEVTNADNSNIQVATQPLVEQSVATVEVQQPVENQAASVSATPSSEGTLVTPVVINQVNNAINAEDFNQSYNQVLEQALESGSMVAIASQAVNNDNSPLPQNIEQVQTEEVASVDTTLENNIDVQSNDGFSSLPDVTNLSDNSTEVSTNPEVEESVLPEEVRPTPEVENLANLEEAGNSLEMANKPISEENIAPVFEVSIPVSKKEKTEENDITSLPEEKNLDPFKDESKNNNEENGNEITTDEKILDKDISSQIEDSTKSEEDLDKLLDTLATTLPKDLSKDIEDTSKLDIFKDEENDEEDKMKDKKEENPVSFEKNESNKLNDEEKPKEEHHEEKEQQEEKKIIDETNEKKRPVKTQIVKKTITNPDGTKKVVMVRRTITAKPKEDVVEKRPEDINTKKVVKKIGQPVNANDKKVIVKTEKKQTPEEGK